MLTKVSDNYISNRAWFRDVLKEQDVILRGVSALEYLQLFNGYFGESNIYVYAKSRGIYNSNPRAIGVTVRGFNVEIIP